MEMNSIPWSPTLWYATPLPMNRTPISTVALQHKSVSSVLRYARPLPVNRIPFRPYAVEHKAISSVLRYARPLPTIRTLFRTWPVKHKVVSSIVRYTSLVSIACSVQALPMNTTTHTILTEPVGSP